MSTTRMQLTLIVALIIAVGMAMRAASLNPAGPQGPRRLPAAAPAAAPPGGMAALPATAVLPYDPVTRIELLHHLRVLARGIEVGTWTGARGAGSALPAPGGAVGSEGGGAHGGGEDGGEAAAGAGHAGGGGAGAADATGAHGRPGPATTTAYIAETFRHIGLLPGGGREYRQRFAAPAGIDYRDGTALRIMVRSLAYDLELGREWRPLGRSESSRARAPIVFCGASLLSGRRDLTPETVRGRIALLLLGSDSAARPAALLAEIQVAARRGALAVLVARAGFAAADEAASSRGALPATFPIPVAELSFDALQEVLGAYQIDLQAVDPVTSPDMLARLEENVAGHIVIDAEAAYREAANVVGWIRGNDPELAGEVIVVGAPYLERELVAATEAAGDGGQAQQLAEVARAGPAVACLLEIAAALGSRRAALRHSVVFVAFGGGTGGGPGEPGARFYAENPARGLEHARLMVSLGLLGNGSGWTLPVDAPGTPALGDLIRMIAADHSVAVVPGATGGGARAPFVERGVPVLAFGTFNPPGPVAPVLVDLYALERESRVVCGIVDALVVDGPRLEESAAR